MLTVEMLRHLWPRAPQAKIDAIAATCGDVFAEFGTEDPKVVAQLMANISHENGAGTIVRESGNYTHAARILAIFGAPHSSAAVTAAEAAALVGRPEALLDRVYNVPKSPKLARGLGNCAPGDGYRYRGNGDLQLTGREAHTRIGKLIGVDLVDHPEMLADPATSFRVAVAEFVALKCVAPASRRQTAVVRRLVNGGNNGLAEVTVWVRKWEEYLPGVEASEPAPRAADSTNKTLMGSKIMQGATGTAASLGTAVVSKVAENANTSTSVVSIQDVGDRIQQASDTITTVQVAKDNATAIVQTMKPFLGLASGTWGAIAVFAIVAASAFIAFTMWERHKKLRDQGV